MSVRENLKPAVRDHVHDLAEAVRARRTSRGLNLRDAAAEIGVPFNSLSRLERGDGFPDLLNYYAICTWVGMPTELPPFDESTGCCAKDGIDCPSCMTGRCAECSECVHYEPRDDEDEAETEIRDWYDTHCSVTGELLDRPAHQERGARD